MGEFFRGWRRKLGVVMLVMACVFTGMWVRGFAFEDAIRLGNGQRIVTRGRVLQTLSTSSRNGLIWKHEETDCDMTWVAGWQSRPVEKMDEFDPVTDPVTSFVNSNVLDWRWQLCGFDIGRFHGATADRLSYWRISHSSITIPLTLISFWLLLTKPRKSNQKKITEPVQVEGT